jgi:integrase
MTPHALPAGSGAPVTPGPAPVEYAVAVERYLDQAALGAASRRVYRISLAGWAWPLVGKPVPGGSERRRAVPPVVPLALLDDPEGGRRLADALGERAAHADARTVNRELSALRSAVGWWREQGWIHADLTTALRHRRPSPAAPAPLSAAQVGALFGLPASMREQAFWRLLYDSGAPAREVLALDAGRLDLRGHRVRPRPGSPAPEIAWRETTSQLLRWLLAGRTWGPVFVTSGKAPARTAKADVCPVTGQARMSYRRAAEIFTGRTRPLDPAGRGWTLHQLRAAERLALLRPRNARPCYSGCRPVSYFTGLVYSAPIT